MDSTEHLEPDPAAPRDRGRSLRSTLLAAGAALGMTLAGLGVAQAQTGGEGGTTATPPPGEFVESVDPAFPRHAARHPARHHGIRVSLAVAAETIGVTVEELRTALEGGRSIAQVAQSKGVAVDTVVDALVAEARERLAEKVESGELTQAEADERVEDLEARVTGFVNREGLPRHGRPGHHVRMAGFEAAAETIGVTVAELRAALEGGQSIAQVAQSKGVDVQAVIDAMVAEATEDLKARITDTVNREGLGRRR